MTEYGRINRTWPFLPNEGLLYVQSLYWSFPLGRLTLSELQGNLGLFLHNTPSLPILMYRGQNSLKAVLAYACWHFFYTLWFHHPKSLALLTPSWCPLPGEAKAIQPVYSVISWQRPVYIHDSNITFI